MPGQTDHPRLGAVIARNVRAERHRAGLRQRDLAARLGWSLTMVGETETGTRRVTAEDLPDLCRGLGVSLATLLVGANPDDLRALRIDVPDL